MTGSQFWKTVIAGLIATFAMTVTGFWQSGLGLAPFDVGAMLTANMSASHPDSPYSLMAGNLVHVANGIVLALIWVAFLQNLVPGNWVVQGVIYAVIGTLVAVVIVVPLASGVGVFFSKTDAPGLMLVSALAAHLAYGLTLTLSLKVAGD